MSRSSTPSLPPTPPSSDSEDSCLNATSSKSSHCQSYQGNLLSSLSIPHPFAASTKADRPPPSYEKKISSAPLICPEYGPNISSGSSDNNDFPLKTLAPRVLKPSLSGTNEQRLWERTISSAVDKAEIKIDLSASGLTYIPPSILDLKSVVILPKVDIPIKSPALRPFSRSITVPASSPFIRRSSPSTSFPSPATASSRAFLPSPTLNNLALRPGKHCIATAPKEQIPVKSSKVELYLMMNKIRDLPRELFALDCLVVLSLRGNKLDSLPPAIGRLISLRELNIANNHITYLPSEIQQLHLTSLHLHPNPFLQYSGESDISGSEKCHSPLRKLGALKRKCPVPTLSELCLRYLLTPVKLRDTSTQSRLEISMDPSNIDALKLPTHIRQILRASTGHGREQRNEKGSPLKLDPNMDMSMNVCPSPQHCSAGQFDEGFVKRHVRFCLNEVEAEGEVKSVFSDAVEERLEWVRFVAGVPLGEEVPIMWRGCSHMCLHFLNAANGVDVTEAAEVACSEDQEFQFSDDED